MKKILILCASVIALTGCDAIQTPIAENHYQSALSSGDIAEQLRYIDELSTLNGEKYHALATQKEKLFPFLLQVMDDPKNLANINDTILKEIIEFSPNNDAFSFIKKYLKEKATIKANIEISIAELEQEKQFLIEKLTGTPSHVKTYKTSMKLAQIKPYFLLSQYIKDFNHRYGRDELDGFQIEAIVRSFAKQYQLNEALMTLTASFNHLEHNSEEIDHKVFSAENQDIGQVLIWLYKKQLLVSFQHLIEQNKHLISLMNNQLGRQSLDDVWLTKVEPVAKKVVMENKESHLNVLNVMSARLAKMSKEFPRFSNLYIENDRIEKLMLSLLWPADGLVNFEQASEINTKSLWLEINKKQQL